MCEVTLLALENHLQDNFKKFVTSFFFNLYYFYYSYYFKNVKISN